MLRLLLTQKAILLGAFNARSFMPFVPRSPAIAGLALVAALIAPPAAAGLLDRLNPFASFESRCTALPDTHVEITALPVTFTEDYSQSLRSLSDMHESAQINHRTVGLTQAQLAFESTLESKGLEDRLGGRVCVKPSVRVVFFASPMTVFVAREFAQDDCRRDMVREHEMRHVAVYRAYLAELVEIAQRQLPAMFGDGPVYARSTQESQDDLRARMKSFMHTFMQARYGELRARQAQIDTPEEYARLGRACTARSAD